MNGITSTSASNQRGVYPLIRRWRSFIGGGLLFLLVQPFSLYAFDSLDFRTAQLAPSQTSELTAKLAAKFLLPKVVGNSDKLARNLGFSGITEFAGTQLFKLDVGPPFPVFRIGLDRLIQWQLQEPIPSPIGLLLEEANFLRWSVPVPAWFLFPITYSGQVRSSVSIAMTASEQTWKIRQIGSPEKIRQLTNHGVPPAYFVVEIPALNRYYLGTITGSDFKIKHVIEEQFPDSIPSIVILAGFEESAVNVFKRLQSEAGKAYQDQAPR